MSWRDILKDLRPDRELRSEIMDVSEVENNFDVDGWPKYIYMNHQDYMYGVGNIGGEVALIYEYEGNGKYRLVNPHFSTVISGVERIIEEEDENDAWGLFSTMPADAHLIRRDYRGTAALKELEGGGALEMYQGEMPKTDKRRFA